MRDDMTIRLGRPGDPEVARLAALDSSRPPVGHTLVAEVDGRAVAAVAWDGSLVVADPFVQSGLIAELLRRRAEEVRGEAVARRLRLWRRGQRPERVRPAPLARGARMALPGPTIQRSALQGR